MITKTFYVWDEKGTEIANKINAYEEDGWAVRCIECIGQKRPYGNYGSLSGEREVLVVLERDAVTEE